MVQFMKCLIYLVSVYPIADCPGRIPKFLLKDNFLIPQNGCQTLIAWPHRVDGEYKIYLPLYEISEEELWTTCFIWEL